MVKRISWHVRAARSDASVSAQKAKVAACVLALLLFSGEYACAGNASSNPAAVAPLPKAIVTRLAAHPRRMFKDIERRTFEYFWNTTDPRTGLTPDRWPTPSPSSIAADGFALTADVIGAYRGYVSREAAAERARTTLAFLASRPQGPGAVGFAGYHGLFYHFLDMRTGVRSRNSELSTIDTALLMAGVLTAESYFDRDTPVERSVRRFADQLYRNVDWRWTEQGDPRVRMGWMPDTGFYTSTWDGYSEGSLLYILGLGSPTHRLRSDAWKAWTSTDPTEWRSLDGETFLAFGPQFANQYTAIWVNFQGIADPFMASHQSNYFQNGQRATLAQQQFAIDDPHYWRGYSKYIWGLTACDGPGNVRADFHGGMRVFHSYAARGITSGDVDDGTLAPTAMVGSLPFAPRVVSYSTVALMRTYGDIIYTQYGFLDSFNPSFTDAALAEHGHVIPGRGWVDGDFIGIDQGPILAMIENERSGLIWKLMQHNRYIKEGLERAGFIGGWLDQRKASPPVETTLRSHRTEPAGRAAAKSRRSPMAHRP